MENCDRQHVVLTRNVDVEATVGATSARISVRLLMETILNIARLIELIVVLDFYFMNILFIGACL